MAFSFCEMLDMDAHCKFSKNLCWAIILIFILGYGGKAVYLFVGTVACCFKHENNCVLGDTEANCESLGGDSRPLTASDIFINGNFYIPDAVFWILGISLLFLLFIAIISLKYLFKALDLSLQYIFCSLFCKCFTCLDPEIVYWHKDQNNYTLKDRKTYLPLHNIE